MVKTSVKYETKYIKLPPNIHFITFSDWLWLASICWGGRGGNVRSQPWYIFFVQSKFYKISLPPNFYQRSLATKFWLKIQLSIKAGFHVLNILWIEKLIFVVTEETRLYLFHTYELCCWLLKSSIINLSNHD